MKYYFPLGEMIRSANNKNRTLFARNYPACYNGCMNRELLEKLKNTTKEEQRILDGAKEINQGLYISPGTLEGAPVGKNFTIDANRLMEKGRQIEIRPHTRFAHFPAHTHNYVELVYMYSGTTTHVLNGTDTITLDEGDLLFLNQHATQEILPAGADDIAINFIILPSFFEQTLSGTQTSNALTDFLLGTLTGRDLNISYLHFHAKDILPIQNLMENMIWNLVEKKKQTNILNQNTMRLVFANLSAFATELIRDKSDEYEQSIVFAALKYIEDNFKEGSLSELSTKEKEAPYYISRLLKKHTGCNFKELLQKRKLEQAAYLLSNTTLTTARILEEIGYDNSSYFHKKFKETYGLSPKQYRQSI